MPQQLLSFGDQIIAFILQRARGESTLGCMARNCVVRFSGLDTPAGNELMEDRRGQPRPSPEPYARLDSGFVGGVLRCNWSGRDRLIGGLSEDRPILFQFGALRHHQLSLNVSWCKLKA